ncbi:glycosyltransferase [Lachnospiraceae bacterium 48-42]|jgi:Uncharacterized conserved protein
MIFVTVGTHEQQFNRLVEYMDNLKKNTAISEKVIIQTGYSTYEPKYCEWRKLFPYEQMIKLVTDARIVITHGGPSSFILPLQIGKVPIVVPRQKKYDEHVNEHQMTFCNEVGKRYGNIITVTEIDKLEKLILNYENIVCDMKFKTTSNNSRFNNELEKIVDQLMKNE